MLAVSHRPHTEVNAITDGTARAGGSRVFGVFFHFPKASQDGKPTVAPAETELVLSYKAGKTEIKVRFSPEKMNLGGASDL